MGELHVALGDHDLECCVVPPKPRPVRRERSRHVGTSSTRTATGRPAECGFARCHPQSWAVPVCSRPLVPVAPEAGVALPERARRAATVAALADTLLDVGARGVDELLLRGACSHALSPGRAVAQQPRCAATSSATPKWISASRAGSRRSISSSVALPDLDGRNPAAARRAARAGRARCGRRRRRRRRACRRRRGTRRGATRGRASGSTSSPSTPSPTMWTFASGTGASSPQSASNASP